MIRSETEFAYGIYRTQLFDSGDLDNVKKVQSGYKAQPLSAFLGQPAPKAAPAIDFIKPLTPELQKTSPEFFKILNFVLRFSPSTHPRRNSLAACSEWPFWIALRLYWPRGEATGRGEPNQLKG